MVQLRRSHNLPSTTCILLSLFNLSSLSLGKAVRNGGLAQKASYGDDLGSLSLKELDYIPRFGEMGQMSMRDSVFHGNRSPMLAVRQEGSIEADCNPGEHSCLGLGQKGCCKNNEYCIVDATGVGFCCALGTQCPSDPCPTSSYFCTTTTTKFTTASLASGSVGNGESSLVTTTATGCCLRVCSVTYHSCAQSFGGNCCPNDNACVPDNKCTPTPGPSTTDSASSEECSASSFSCDDGGCCPDGFLCTKSGSNPGCIKSGASTVSRDIFTNEGGLETGDPTVTPTDRGGGQEGAGKATATDGSSTEDDTGADNGGDGLSAGAKAGIGIGAGVGVLALIAAGVFLVFRKRSAAKDAAAAQATQPPPPAQQFSPPPGPYQQSPYPQSSPQMQQQGFFDPNTMQQPQQYAAYPPVAPPPPQGYYPPQSPGKPSPDQRPVSYAPPPMYGQPGQTSSPPAGSSRAELM